MRERGLIPKSGVVQENLQISPSTGQIYQEFDFSDVCPVDGRTGLSRSAIPGLSRYARIERPEYVSWHHLQSLGCRASATFGVDKNALAILNSNLIPLPNAPYGCNFSSPISMQPVLTPPIPNHCYIASVSPSTYWREELFRIDQALNSKAQAVVSLHSRCLGYDVLTPQWGYLSTTHPSAATFRPYRTDSLGPASVW